MDERGQAMVEQSPPGLESADEATGGHSVGAAAVLWGLGGVLYVLIEATTRLAWIALEAFDDMPGHYWAAAIIWMIFNAYAEGYKGFQKAFVPRLVARATLLWRHPTALRTLLAPMFLMGLVDATPKRLTVSWVLVGAITGLVIWVRALPQPLRGVIDAGVVVGLGWGIAAILVLLLQTLNGRPSTADPEVAR